MSNPQLEDGYLRIATEIAKQFCSYSLSGYEWRVLWVLWIKTYGWQKKSDKIALSQFAIMTGLTRSHVVRSLNKLISKGVIKKGNSIPATYSFIKHYKLWKVLPKKVRCYLKRCEVLPKKGTKVLPKKVHTRDTKDTITKDTMWSQSETLLAQFSKENQKLVNEYIELSEKENKTGKILDTKRLRLINELFNIYIKSDPVKFAQALEVTVKNQAPNPNYLKKVYKNIELKKQVGINNKAEQSKKEWDEGVKKGEKRASDTKKLIDSYK